MRRQTKNSDDVPEANATPALSLTCRSGDMQAIVLQAGRVDSLNYCADYEGYRLKARASPTDNALYAADLVVERRGFPSRHFHALDYFYDAKQALRYATRWGRIWVDHQMRKIAGKENLLGGRQV